MKLTKKQNRVIKRLLFGVMGAIAFSTWVALFFYIVGYMINLGAQLHTIVFVMTALIAIPVFIFVAMED